MDIEESNPERGKRKATGDAQDGAAKRKRVSRACDRCRTKKDKCNGQRPACSACIAAGQICLYDPSTKKRGLPEGYVRGLEKLWALCIDKVQGLEDVVSCMIEEHNQDLLDIWNHETIGENLHATWKDSKILHELEAILSRLESDSSLNLKKTREKEEDVTDKAAELSFHRLPRYHLKGGADLSGLDPTSPLAQRDAMQKPPLIHPSLPKRASGLIDTYFSFTHCWFPIVERHRVLKTTYSYTRQPAACQAYTADLSVLWAILAYTDTQSTADAGSGNTVDPQERTEMTAEQMQKTARQLIPDENGPFEIGHVQALLLLVLLYIGQGNWSCAWALVGQTTRIALDLGLGTGTSKKHGTNVLYGCFILDTLVSAHLMRPALLRRQDIEAVGYLEEDGHDEWDPWTTSKAPTSVHREPAFIVSCFNRLVDIFMIMNDTISDRRTGREKQIYFQARADELRDMPSKFPMPIGSEGPPHHVYLQLFHLSTNILVLRESFDGGAPSDPLARLACEILILLTKYAQQNPSLGLAMIPPVLENPIRSACYAAIAARPSFDQLQGLPSYNAFARKMTDHTSGLCSVWPVFAGLTKLWQKEIQAGPLDIFGAANLERCSTSNWQNTDNGPVSRHANASAISHQGRAVVDLEGFDVPMSGVEQPTSLGEPSALPAGLTMPASDPSPSFQGDDIDAIFHNLAHLDTTDWTNGREQGLQDFGFTDETTFQAFCNDPERLATSAGTSSGNLAHDVTTSFWPPPGFFPGYFGEPDAQVDASQILQSLSGGNDPYSTLSESVEW